MLAPLKMNYIEKNERLAAGTVAEPFQIAKLSKNN